MGVGPYQKAYLTDPVEQQIARTRALQGMVPTATPDMTEPSVPPDIAATALQKRLEIPQSMSEGFEFGSPDNYAAADMPGPEQDISVKPMSIPGPSDSPEFDLKKKLIERYSGLQEPTPYKPSTSEKVYSYGFLPILAGLENYFSKGRSNAAMGEVKRMGDVLGGKQEQYGKAMERYMGEKGSLENKLASQQQFEAGAPMREAQLGAAQTSQKLNEQNIAAKQQDMDRYNKFHEEASTAIATLPPGSKVEAINEVIAPIRAKYYPEESLYKETNNDWLAKLIGAENLRNAPKPMPATETNKITEIDNSFNAINGILENFNPEFVGPAKGRMGSVKEDLRLLGTDEAKFRINVAELKGKVRNALYGGALTPSEQKAFDDQFPSYYMSPETFIATFRSLQNQLAEKRKTALANLSSTFITQPLQEKPPSPFVPSTGGRVINTQAEYDALELGEKYVDSQGNPGQKR